jgi:non-heme chloroperoxidase
MSYLQTKEQNVKMPVNLYYEDWGSGQPIVLIHGWPLSHEMWEYQVYDLVHEGFRVIAYDRRGFGKSSKPWSGYDYDTLADDLHALIETLNLYDVVLVGFSMGAGEVARYFARHGGARVSKAVLLGGITPGLLQSAANSNGVAIEVFNDMVKQICEDRMAFLDNFGKQFFGVNLLKRPLSNALLEYYRTLASFASPKATIDCVYSFGETDFTEDMPAINVPTLIIHGDADKIVPMEATSDRAAQLIANNQYLRYEGAPHGFFYTDKERLNTDLIQFIKEESTVDISRRMKNRL